MKRLASKRNPWVDHYARQAKKDKFPARSVYKLQEIQRKYALIKKGHKVLDLGCSPGSWLLYAAGLTGAAGKIIGIDLKAATIRVPAHVEVITADVLTLDVSAMGNDFDVVLSDLAPATTGHKGVDATRSFNLCTAALAIAARVLTPGGSFVCKIFQGQDFKHFSDTVRANFQKCTTFKPQSSRKASKEIFIIGLDFKNN